MDEQQPKEPLSLHIESISGGVTEDQLPPREVEAPESSDETVEIEETITIAEWLFSFFVMLIPVFNIIMFLFWMFNKDTNHNKRNWAWAALIFVVTLTALYFILFRYFFRINISFSGA